MDRFEDLKEIKPGTIVTFQVEDGHPISGVFGSADESARTVTLQPGNRVIKFPAAAPLVTGKVEEAPFQK